MELLLPLRTEFETFMYMMYDTPEFFWGIAAIVIFDVVCKAFALWRAARMGMTVWFVALVLINSIGLLPIAFTIWTRKRYNSFVCAARPA